MEWQADERMVRVPVGAKALDGNLTLPASPIGVVLLAHGSGSSRHSPRNRYELGCSTRRGWRLCW
jgi:putative phosphoribosyl transferase